MKFLVFLYIGVSWVLLVGVELETCCIFINHFYTDFFSAVLLIYLVPCVW